MTKTQPLVSIFVLCYNHELYLDDCLQGLLNQTYENIELIIYDDESQDKSWEKINAYRDQLVKKFPRVILERHQHKGGAKEVAMAVEKITGDFFCYLESDDYYYPEKVERNVQYLMTHPEVALVHSDIDYVYPDRVVRSFWKTTEVEIPTGAIFNPLIKRNFIQTCSVCVRSEVYKKYVSVLEYEKKGYLIADHCTFLDIAPHASIDFIPESLAAYRVLPESASHSLDPKRYYLIHKSAKKIRLDYSHKYNASREIQEAAELEYYSYLFKNSFSFFLEKDYLDGLAWFKKKYPEKNFDTWGVRLRLLSFKNSFFWFFLKKWLEVKRRFIKK